MYIRIQQVRKSLGLTQKEFGLKLGVSRDVISNIENGRVEPKEAFINLLCSLYNVNKKWLETGEGEIFLNTTSQITKDYASYLFSQLEPEFQEYVLKKMKELLDIQEEKPEI